MRDNNNKPESHVAYGAAMDGVSALVSSVAVVGRYYWNIQMQLLVMAGIMPLFRRHWWLFFLVGFILLAFIPPLGIAFIVSVFCAGHMDPKAKDNYIVPLRQEDCKTEYEASANSTPAANPILSSLTEDEQESLYISAGIAHASVLNAMSRELNDAEFSAAALGAFDGTVQGLGICLTDVEMFIMGSVFIVRQLKALDRLDEVDPEKIADLTTEAMDSPALNETRELAGKISYSVSRQMRGR
jgi:hypothetical protein